MQLSKSSLKAIGELIVCSELGVSSSTMLGIAFGAVDVEGAWLDAPNDAEDLGRCIRLVERVPELLDNFKHIGRRVPRFKGILENWAMLVAMHKQEIDLESRVNLYNKIQELRVQYAQA
jgi:hypothetical protein